LNGLERRLAGAGVDAAWRHVEQVVAASAEAGNGMGVCCRGPIGVGDASYRIQFHDFDGGIPQLSGPPEDLRVAHDKGPNTRVDARIGPGCDDHLRPDAGRIAHGDGQKWLFGICHEQ
jgi:hypothetical protein